MKTLYVEVLIFGTIYGVYVPLNKDLHTELSVSDDTEQRVLVRNEIIENMEVRIP